MDGFGSAVADYSCSVLFDLSTIRMVLLVVFGAAMYGLVQELSTVLHPPKAQEGPPESPNNRPRAV